MSKASIRRRNKITLALGAFAIITFGTVYGVVAHNTTIDQSSAVANVGSTTDATPRPEAPRVDTSTRAS